MNWILFIFEILGTAAFAVSGAFVAIHKKMDIFGVAMLGLTTAIGGGIIRDLILGVTPPKAFQDPTCAAIAIICSLLVFIPRVRRFLLRQQLLWDYSLLVLDSVGLGAFSVVGVQCAVEAGFAENLFLQVFVGAMTGVGGGILRDIFSQNTPYVFAKHFYACASILGALCCALFWNILGQLPAMMLGAALTFVLRLLAAHFRWSLPKA